MPSVHTHRLAVVIVGCLSFVRCGGAGPDEQARSLSFVTEQDTTANNAVAIVRLQRELFLRLARRHELTDITTDDFVVRNAPSGESADSIVAAEWRQAQLLEALNARSALDTSALAMTGDLSAYADFHAYPMGTRQIVVLAKREDGSIALTTWRRSGSTWQASSVLFNPSEELLASMKERSAGFTNP